MPTAQSISDWKPAREFAPLDFFNPANEDYYSERAKYEFMRRLFRPVRLVARNAGGIAATGELSFSDRVFSENLPQPREFVLTIAATVTGTSMTVAQLRALPEPASADE